MKKFYLLITLLLLCVGATTSAYGQFVYATIDSNPTAADNIETGVYVVKMYSKQRTGYVYDNGGAGGVYVNGASNYVCGTKVLSLNMLWYVRKITTDNETYYTVQSVRGKYLPNVTANGRAELSDSYGYYTMEAASQNYLTEGAYMKARGTNYYVICNSNTNNNNTEDLTLGQWENCNNVDGTIGTPDALWSFYKADVSGAAMESIINNYSSITSLSLDDYCGYVGAFDATEVANAWSNFLTDCNYEEFSSAFTTAQTNAAANGLVELNNTTYYQIKSLREPKVFFSSESISANTEGIVTDEAETKMVRTNGSDFLIPQLWKFEPTGHGKILHHQRQHWYCPRKIRYQ